MIEKLSILLMPSDLWSEVVDFEMGGLCSD